jgi:hypothetical protein
VSALDDGPAQISPQNLENIKSAVELKLAERTALVLFIFLRQRKLLYVLKIRVLVVLVLHTIRVIVVVFVIKFTVPFAKYGGVRVAYCVYV